MRIEGKISPYSKETSNQFLTCARYNVGLLHKAQIRIGLEQINKGKRVEWDGKGLVGK